MIFLFISVHHVCFSDFVHNVTRRELSLVEGNAAFSQRCSELDRTGNFGNALTAQNINTFSAMAFALGTPQTPPTDQQFDTLAQTIFGGGFTLGQTSMLRRLHFESTTLMIASVKQRVDGESSDRPDSVKRIPVAEKRYRLEQQEQRLAGIAISGEMEPSHQLLDLTNNVVETGSIIWIAPSRCTVRRSPVVDQGAAIFSTSGEPAAQDCADFG